MIILASLSPRRRELLKGLGLDVKVVGSNVDEDMFKDNKNPLTHVLRLSLEKAKNVSEKEKGVIIGADTIVFLDGEIIGKPKDEEDAKVILRRISGRVHTVYTGFTIIDNRTPIKTYQRAVSSEVKIKELTPEEIEWYVSTGEPMDKAGAYAVQGLGAFMVEWIKGSWTNVVGLPLTEVVQALKEMGVLEFTKEGLKIV